MGTEVSSSNAAKLADLSVPTLARIAVLVGDTVDTMEGRFDESSLPLIQPLRATCRLLREATNLAIGTLSLNYMDDTGLRIKSKEDPLPGHSVFVPLDFVLSLPCLYELMAFGLPLPDNFARVLEVIPGLKRIALTDNFEVSTIRFKAFESANTVEKFNIWGLGEQAMKDLFSFRYDRLTDLSLGNLDHVPIIPQPVLASVRSVSLSIPRSRDADLWRFYESLTKGQNLQSLKICNCTLEGVDLLHKDDRFGSLTKLSVSVFEDSITRLTEHSTWLTKALRNGRFPCLQELELHLGVMGFEEPSLDFSEIEPALAALGPGLRKLTISTELGMTIHEISILKRLQSSRTFELHITMKYKPDNQPIMPIQMFTGLSSLTSIHFCRYFINNLEELASFPNLKEVSFTGCIFPEKTALKLRETCGSIEKIMFFNCRASPKHVLWDGTLIPS